jgi:hypothetical protein
MINRQVQIFQHEDFALLIGNVRNAVEGVASLEPHRAGHDLTRSDWQPAIIEPVLMQIEPGNAQLFADRNTFFRRGKQFLGSLIVGQSVAHIANGVVMAVKSRSECGRLRL